MVWLKEPSRLTTIQSQFKETKYSNLDKILGVVNVSTSRSNVINRKWFGHQIYKRSGLDVTPVFHYKVRKRPSTMRSSCSGSISPLPWPRVYTAQLPGKQWDAQLTFLVFICLQCGVKCRPLVRFSKDGVIDNTLWFASSWKPKIRYKSDGC